MPQKHDKSTQRQHICFPRPPDLRLSDSAEPFGATEGLRAASGSRHTMDEGSTYQGDQALQVTQRRQDVWASLRKTLVVVASTSVVLLALRNSLTYHLQHFWGASGDFWQHQWDKIVLACNNDPYVLLVYGPTLSSYALYWSVGAVYILMDVTGKPSFLRRYKVQPGTNEPVEMGPLIKCSLWVTFNQLVAGTAFSGLSYYVMCFRGFDQSPLLPTFHWVLFELMVCILVEEVGFYYTHRLFHHRLLYKHFHKWHHEWQSPVSVTALYTHPLEHIISNMAPVILGLIILGSHPATVWLWCGLANLSTINAHCGYHLPFFPSPEAHDYHHLKFNQCYGVLGILDRLHGTDEKFRQSKQYARNITMFSLVPPREAFPDDVPKGKRAIRECKDSYDGDGGSLH
nr:fatty acid hydroxylase domain-containing protein 2 like A [Penaeus japonicus]